jgi:hypothetical protein
MVHPDNHRQGHWRERKRAEAQLEEVRREPLVSSREASRARLSAGSYCPPRYTL